MDKGYYFDFAVYSSLKVIQGKPFFAEFHVDRLFASARVIGLNHQFSVAEVLDWIAMLISASEPKDVLLRILLIGDPDSDMANVYIFPVTGVTYYPNEYYSHGVKTITYRGERRFPTAKTTDLLLSFVALRDAKRQDAFEALMIDADECIREGSRCNFFAIKGNTLYSPPNEKTLMGITKKIVLEQSEGVFKIRQEDIPLSAIHTFDECFLTSTLMNVMPIQQIDDVVFPTGFEKTKELARLYREFTDE